MNVNVFGFVNGVDENLIGLEGVVMVDKMNFFTNLGELDGAIGSTIATTIDHNGFILIERAVASGAVGDILEILGVVEVEMARVITSGEDELLGLEGTVLGRDNNSRFILMFKGGLEEAKIKACSFIFLAKSLPEISKKPG